MSDPSAQVHSKGLKEVKRFSECVDIDVCMSIPCTDSKSCIGSQPFSVVVGAGDRARSFAIHQDFLVNESDRLAKSVHGGFREEHERKIVLDEEDPELFGYFVEFMYLARWGLGDKITMDVEYVVLARLYTLADRLQASRFQKAVFHKFNKTFPRSTEFEGQLTQYLPAQHVCELLEIVLGELPEGRKNDPLRDGVYWLASHRLKYLKGHPHYLRLCEEHPALPNIMNATYYHPDLKDCHKPLPRFKPESTFSVSSSLVDFSKDRLY